MAVAAVRAEIVTIFASGDPSAPESYYPRATSSAYTNTYRLQVFSNGFNPWTMITNWTLTNWTITFKAGEVCKMIGGRPYPRLAYQVGSDTNTNRQWYLINAGGSAETPTPFALVGPGSVAIYGTQNQTAYGDLASFATFSITRAEDFASPSNLLAVEPDAAGPVAIRMESSTNLADWLPAYPGTYGVASQMRFFRLRATRSILDAPAGP